MSKKFLSFVLALVLLIGLIPVGAISVSAADYSAGTSMTATYADGVLTFKGSGKINGAASASEAANISWVKAAKNATAVVFPKGVTKIGGNLFTQAQFPNLQKVIVENVSAWCAVDFGSSNPLSYAHNLYVGKDAASAKVVHTLEVSGNAVLKNGVFNNAHLTGVKVSGNVQIADSAFAGNPDITAVSVSGNAKVGANAFAGCPKLTGVSVTGKATVGSSAFSACTALEKANVSSEAITALPASLFNSCAALKSVSLPGKLQSVGEKAFEYCASLNVIGLPDTVTSIGASAFNGSGLQQITVPKNLKSVGAGAFAGCEKLAGANIQNLEGWCNVSFADVDANPAAVSGNFYLNNSKIGKLTLGENILSVGDHVFENCKSITEVSMTSRLEKLSMLSFAGCDKITDVYFASIAQRDAFSNRFASSFKAVMHPEGDSAPGSVGKNLVYEIKGDTLSIKGKGSVIDNAAWSSDPAINNVKKIVLPGSITNITVASGINSIPNLRDVVTEDLGAFCQMDTNSESILPGHNLVYKGQRVLDLNIPNGVTQINPYLFSGANFNSVSIPGSVKKIDNGAFYDCKSLKKVSIANGVGEIGPSAFDGCTQLSSINIPGSVKTVGFNAFADCTGLTSVTVNDGTAKIANNAFSGCTSLQKVSLPNSLKELGNGAFMGCEKLESVNIPTALPKINDNTFSGCAKLTQVTIPASVKHIGTGAFDGCTGLQRVYTPSLDAWCAIDFNDNPLTKAHSLYVNGKLVEDLKLPNLTEIKHDTFSGAECITSVTIPNTVEHIQANAFSGCLNIKDVYVEKATWDAMVREGGNECLENANIHFVDLPDETEPPQVPGGKIPVDEKLVELITARIKPSLTAYETYKGSGKYLIGYGTPSKKGAKISQKDAVNTLRDYLEMAAWEVNNVIPSLPQHQLDALASFTFFNNKDWLSGGPLLNAVNTAGSDILGAFVAQSAKKSADQLNLRLCEAHLYMTGEYNWNVNPNYSYVKLDPNGGISAAYGNVQGYDLTKSTPILPELTPYWKNNEMKFVGWYSKAQGGAQITALDNTTEGVTLYAHWQKKDSGVDGETIVGKKVDYYLPARLATTESRLTNSANDRIRVFVNPVTDTAFDDLQKLLHIALVDPETVVHVTAEYRHPETGHLWVQLKDSGWIDLGHNIPTAVETGMVEVDLKKQLSVMDNHDAKANMIGSLHNGDRVAVFERFLDTKTNTNWGKTVFFNNKTMKYGEGWINLAYVKLDGSMNHEGDGSDENQNKLTLKGTGIVINTDRVNVRANPRPDATKVDSLKRGTTFNIYDYSTYIGKQWDLTSYGWICADYIDETKADSTAPEKDDANKEDTSGNVGTDDNKKVLASGYVFNNINLTVRRGPGNGYQRVRDLNRGERVHVYQTRMFNGVQWGRISEESKIMPEWVCMSYVTLDGNAEIKNPEKPNEPVKKLGQGLVYNCSTGVNLRASATAHSAFQGVAPVGTTVELLEEVEKDGITWYRTPKGYACGLYIKKVDVPVTPVNPQNPVDPQNPQMPGNFKSGIVFGADSVNVRNLPGVFGHAVVTTLRAGSSVRIYDETSVDGSMWYKIDQGWISAQYVQLGNANNAGGLGTTQTTGNMNTTGTVLERGLSILAGAGNGYKSVGKYPYGEVVTIVEQKLVDGVAFGRTDKGWVNLKFLSMNGTGVTGTGTMGTVINCKHSVNVRIAPSGVAISNLRLGSRVEVLETTDLGNNNVWGRTPLGWVSMNYIQTDGPVNQPVIPQQPVAPTEPQKPEGEKPNPSDQGIPVVIKATVRAEGTDLRMVPGYMGDWDATIVGGTAVEVTKLDSVDGVVWGRTLNGWINMTHTEIKTYAVPTKALIVWKDASTTQVVGALDHQDMVTITALKIDDAKKVWAKIYSPDGWIELTEVTELENFDSAFMVKGSISVADTIVRISASETAEQVGAPLAAGELVTVTAIQKDEKGDVWANISTGWVKVANITGMNGEVSEKVLVTWNDPDLSDANNLLKQGAAVNIANLMFNSANRPVALLDTGVYVDLSGIITH